MKATLLFVTLATWMTGSEVFAATELEALRERCARQEQEIRKLESQVRQQQGSEVRSTSAAKSAPATTPAAASTGSSNAYVVRKGDSLERIARRQGCSAKSLAKLNGLKSTSLIHPGQKLKLPGSTAIARTAPAEAKPATAAPQAISSSTPKAATSSASGSHRIAPGETYASIARKHRVSVDSLIAANPGVKPTALRPGQVIQLGAAASSKPAPVPTLKPTGESRPAQAIVSAIGSTAPSHEKPHTAPSPAPAAPATASIPTSIPSQAMPTSQPVSTHTPSAPAPAPAAAPEPAPAPSANAAATPPAPNNNPEKKIRSVTIEGEMSYGEFAAKHGTDTDRLNDLNGLDLTHATVLAKGSELYVPAQP